MTPLEIATQRANLSDNPPLFMDAYEVARADASSGDPEGRWLRMLATRAPAAALAGYVEGLASVRPWVPQPPRWRLTQARRRREEASCHAA